MISIIVSEILTSTGKSQTALAAELGVSEQTVRRWLEGRSLPKPEMEGKLREIHQGFHRGLKKVSSLSIDMLNGTGGHELLRISVDSALQAIREAFYRHSKLSSRNEVLDEISKIIYAHMKLEYDCGEGISRRSFNGLSPKEMSEAFISRVNKVCELSFGLGDGVEDSTAFLLRIRSSEVEMIQEIIDSISRIELPCREDVAGFDLLNEVFGSFLNSSFVNEKELGQFLTPPEVVRFMVAAALNSLHSQELDMLCDPEKCVEFGIILDPSCGAGSFLVQVVHLLHPIVLARHGEVGAKLWQDNMSKHVLLGIDKSERMARLSMANLSMIGIIGPEIHSISSLDLQKNNEMLSKKITGNVGLIVTNPPFGATFSSNSLLGYKVFTEWASRKPKSVPSEVLFVEKYYDWLREGGRCAVVVPDSILTNKSVYNDLRRGLSGQVCIESVVSLPSATFEASGTSTKTSFLQFMKKAPDCEQEKTYFAICNNIGYETSTKSSVKSKRSQAGGELPGILHELSSDALTLSIGRKKDIHNSGRWDANFHAGLPEWVERKIEKLGDSAVKVSDVADLVQDRLNPKRLPSSTFKYIEISDVSNKTTEAIARPIGRDEASPRARKVVKAGDVLVPTVRPENQSIGIVSPSDDEAICSTGFAVLRPKGIHAKVLAALLKSEFVRYQFIQNNMGIAYPAIEESCVLDIVLPIEKNEIVKLFHEAEILENKEIEVVKWRDQFSESISHATKCFMANS